MTASARNSEGALKTLGVIDGAIDLVAQINRLLMGSAPAFYDASANELVIRDSIDAPFARPGRPASDPGVTGSSASAMISATGPGPDHRDASRLRVRECGHRCIEYRRRAHREGGPGASGLKHQGFKAPLFGGALFVAAGAA